MARVVTSSAPAPPLQAPQRAWVIVELGWEHSDEFTCAEGETPLTQLFFNKALADAECQRLCKEFFAAETPAEFEADLGVTGIPGCHSQTAVGVSGQGMD